MGDVFSVILLASVASFVALIGGILFLVNRKWSDWLSCYSTAFAAGILLTVSLTGLLPEAIHAIGEAAFLVTLLSFLAAYLFEHLFFGIHHHNHLGHGKDYSSAIPLVIIGDTIHNFVDGIAIAASYLITPGLGVIVTISTFLHEIPHEIGDFGILLRAGWKRKRILLVNVISASFTIVGALFVMVISDNEAIIGYSLAFSAGLFLYLGASDFLPHIHEGDKKRNDLISALLIGVLVMLAVNMLFPHSHESEDEPTSNVSDNSVISETTDDIAT